MKKQQNGLVVPDAYWRAHPTALAQFKEWKQENKGAVETDARAAKKIQKEEALNVIMQKEFDEYEAAYNKRHVATSA
jgi:hypothetical protein